MLINISQAEIEHAIKEHIHSQGISTRGKEVVVTLETTGGRKSPREWSATVAIAPAPAQLSEAAVNKASGDDIDFS